MPCGAVVLNINLLLAAAAARLVVAAFERRRRSVVAFQHRRRRSAAKRKPSPTTTTTRNEERGTTRVSRMLCASLLLHIPSSLASRTLTACRSRNCWHFCQSYCVRSTQQYPELQIDGVYSTVDEVNGSWQRSNSERIIILKTTSFHVLLCPPSRCPAAKFQTSRSRSNCQAECTL